MSIEQVFDIVAKKDTRVILLVVSRVSETGSPPYSRVAVGEVLGHGRAQVVGSTVDKSAEITGLSILQYCQETGVARETICPCCGYTFDLLGER